MNANNIRYGNDDNDSTWQTGILIVISFFRYQQEWKQNNNNDSNISSDSNGRSSSNGSNSMNGEWDEEEE